MAYIQGQLANMYVVLCFFAVCTELILTSSNTFDVEVSFRLEEFDAKMQTVFGQIKNELATMQQQHEKQLKALEDRIVALEGCDI